MTSTSSDPSRLHLGLTRNTWALVAAIIVGMAFAGTAIGLLMRDRAAVRDERDAVADQSQQLVDCVRNPSASDCQQKADKVEETIANTKAGDPGADGSDGRDGADGQDGVDGADGERGPQGPQGPRGPRGFIGPVGPTGAPGQDGADGAPGENGATGDTGPIGPQGATGPTGATGDRGPAGVDGKDGRDGVDGTAIPGTYTCDDGSYLHGFTVADDGAVTLDCRPLVVTPILEAP